jgi:alanyl-tRNA synthetase
MNQFKEVFLGLEQREYTKATTAQKCVRAGGKHNDLENVGYTARHHTFFEMLGNFSFGDYFKREAIKYAWEFLTSVAWLNLPADRLYVTVYHTDEEAYAIWQQEIGLSAERIIRIGDKPGGGSDNFWQMGDTGPCGPCTEIFYDHGPEVKGGLPGTPDEDGDRYIEIWNNVFMQFNRDENGNLQPLPKPSVDTGMGIERIAAVLQHVHSNYEIDLFAKLITAAADITHASDKRLASLKVIADHIRSVSFLIADGALPANDGRGYVLRRIIRRAIRHGYKLGCRAPFFYNLVATLVREMGDAYPELILNQEQIEKTIFQEEERFFQTIDHGMTLLNEQIANKIQELPGNLAFKLYDTYGFPLDLTQDVCREHDIKVDIAGFDAHMAQQREMAKAAGKFKMTEALEYTGPETKFIGYHESSCQAKVIALYRDTTAVAELKAGERGIVVLDTTVFYAESGGQIGDSGTIVINGGASCLFEVDDTQKIRAAVFGHSGYLTIGSLKVGDSIVATIDLHQRLATMRHHSVTHLMHKALHEVVGSHATQKGSLVTHDYTRFDFANDEPLSSQQISEIERIVNHVIMQNYPVLIAELSYEDALKAGAVALFGEKYGDKVRVIQMGQFSTELCGGTHVSRTGEIGLFKIISESGVANGVRRIEAISGERAIAYLQQQQALLEQTKALVKAPTYQQLPTKIESLLADNKALQKEIAEFKAKLASLQADSLLSQAKVLTNGAKLLVLRLDGNEGKSLVELIDKFKDKLHSGIVIIGAVNDDKVNLAVGVTKDLTQEFKAGAIVAQLAAMVGGKGGGRPDLAQAGGTNPQELTAALNFAQTMFH